MTDSGLYGIIVSTTICQKKIIRMLTVRLCFTGMMLACSLQLFAAEKVSEISVRFTGLKEDDLVEKLKQTTSFSTFADLPPSAFLLQRRAQQYVPRLQSILTSHGYYAADISVDVARDRQDQLEVVYQVDPGPIFRIDKVTVDIAAPEDGGAPRKKPIIDSLGIRSGDTAEASPIRTSAKRLQESLRQQGFAFATVDQPEVQVDTENKTVRVVLRADTGPLTYFGSTEVKGLASVREEFVQNTIPWESGQRYDPELVGKLRKRLIESELFSVIRVQRGVDQPQPELPMLIDLTEADPRLISAGLGYDSDRGVGVTAAWEHRNLRGRGERLAFNLNVSPVLQDVSLTYRKPHFLHQDSSLILRSALISEDSDAYDTTSLKLSAQIERRLTPHLTVTAGIAGTGTHQEEEGESTDFYFLSLPLTIDWDRRNDILDPTRGWWLSAGYEPFKEFISGDLLFHKTSVTGRWYYKLAPSWIVAFRTRIGMIFAEDAEDLPADERFYAGGGGSIRGYPYQEVGPHRDDEPTGGRSLLEVTTEIRWKWTENIGWAVFLDGGNVYKDGLTDIDGELFWGSGLGIRYYTPFGPLRLDVAVPLNKPEHIDENYQLYISLGQAF